MGDTPIVGRKVGMMPPLRPGDSVTVSYPRRLTLWSRVVCWWRKHPLETTVEEMTFPKEMPSGLSFDQIMEWFSLNAQRSYKVRAACRCGRYIARGKTASNMIRKYFGYPTHE